MARSRKYKKLNLGQMTVAVIILIGISIYGYIRQNANQIDTANAGLNNYVDTNSSNVIFDLSTIPEYLSSPYVEINNNIPYFVEGEYTTEPFEKYSELDYLGRSGVGYANICKEIMPPKDEERGEIGGIKPTGWVQKRYDNLIKDKYLYNRCHLIGWQLSGENANKNNLITGTRYLNTEGMLPFENEIAEYIDKNANNHVLYRVTPIFEGNNLLASGVEMEALSVEDSGQGVRFNVYCYNVQPGIEIDYATGQSHEK